MWVRINISGIGVERRIEKAKITGTVSTGDQNVRPAVTDESRLKAFQEAKRSLVVQGGIERVTLVAKR